VVKEVNRKRNGPQRNLALGDYDRPFDEPVPIDSAPWFEQLRRKTGNFAFGLQHIKDHRIIARLIQAAAKGGSSDSVSRQLAGTGVLPGGRRIEVHPDFDTNTFERLV